MASELCGSMPSKNWGSRFIARHEHELGKGFLDSIDLSRCRSESKISFANYFLRISQKFEQLNIGAENIYNMDEKGFLIGEIQKSRRIFTKEFYESGKLVGADQDGSREWITVIDTICADGSKLSPALIYKATSGEFKTPGSTALIATNTNVFSPRHPMDGPVTSMVSIG
ncbi:hypothetical protein K3495_g12772 [Podosphaera aphanis]|nr:hypothetical protein K3495_g12772 [Podosphaera aphanis]